MLYVVFSFVFIKYVNDRFLLNLVDRSTLGLIHRPRGSVLLSHPARVTRLLQEIVSSFAVAKVYQIPNTNQISTRKSPQNIPQSCTHFPINKTLTTMEKILRQQCNVPSSLPRDSPQFRPKIIRITPFPSSPQPKGAPRPRQKGASSPSPKGTPRPRLKGGDRPTSSQG